MKERLFTNINDNVKSLICTLSMNCNNRNLTDKIYNKQLIIELNQFNNIAKKLKFNSYSELYMHVKKKLQNKALKNRLLWLIEHEQTLESTAYNSER